MSTRVKTLESMSETALVAACRGRDGDAWRELVSRYSRLVYSIPLQAGLCEADASDVYQTVFVALHEQLHRLRDPASLTKWLIRTTHRTAARHVRQLRRAEPLGDRDDRADDAPLPVEMADRWEQQHVIRTALRRLGGRCAALLTALYLEPGPASYDEVAARLDIPRGSIGPTRTRCLAKLTVMIRAGGLVER